VLAVVEQWPELAAPVGDSHPDMLAQVVHAVEQEGARTLADVMLRRLTVGMSAGRGRDGVEAVSTLMAELLGWDATRLSAERVAWEEQISHGAAPALEATAPPGVIAATV
jgi:glycerol-3-phosphate dehydrogenase